MCGHKAFAVLSNVCMILKPGFVACVSWLTARDVLIYNMSRGTSVLKSEPDPIAVSPLFVFHPIGVPTRKDTRLSSME